MPQFFFTLTILMQSTHTHTKIKLVSCNRRDKSYSLHSLSEHAYQTQENSSFLQRGNAN